MRDKTLLADTLREIAETMKTSGEMRELEDELLLDFDLRDADSVDWWAEQDAELEQQELEQIESAAEIQENIHNGYWE